MQGGGESNRGVLKGGGQLGALGGVRSSQGAQVWQGGKELGTLGVMVRHTTGEWGTLSACEVCK